MLLVNNDDCKNNGWHHEDATHLCVLFEIYDVFLDNKGTTSHFFGAEIMANSTELHKLDMKIRFQGRSLTDALGPLAKCYSIPLVCRPIDAIKTVASCQTKLFQKSKAEEVFLFLPSLSSLSRVEWRGADTVPAIWSIFWTGRTLYKEGVGKFTGFIFFFFLTPSPLCSKLSGTLCCYRISDNWRAEDGILSCACVPLSCWLIQAEQFIVNCTWLRFQAWAFSNLQRRSEFSIVTSFIYSIG